MADKVIDLEMNKEGVMEEKKSLPKRIWNGMKEHKKEILLTTTGVVVGLVGGMAFGYSVLPKLVEEWTKPEVVLEVAGEVAKAAV